jgi:molybdopterin synthase catalytic subunit
MIEVSPDELREAVESQHGGTATFVQAVPVREELQGQAVWEGVVHVFLLEYHPMGATRAYAWSHAIDDTDRRRFVTVLHAGPVDSPLNAVRAALMAEHRGKT